jgi:hypothetical protein
VEKKSKETMHCSDCKSAFQIPADQKRTYMLIATKTTIELTNPSFDKTVGMRYVCKACSGKLFSTTNLATTNDTRQAASSLLKHHR